MAIRVEFIKKRPGGRITVRPIIYDKTELTLGRATDCDIHLADLRVGLHHARLTILSARKARIEANGDHRVRVNGAQIRRRDIELGENSLIRIGPYQLSFAEAETSETLLVSIELVEAPTPIRDRRDEAAVFSMRGYAPDKRVTAWVSISFILAAFLFTPILLHFRSSEPDDSDISARLALATNQHWLAGELSSAHANLVEDCRDCHVKPFTRVKDEDCLACHDEMRNHAEPTSLHKARPIRTGAGKWLATIRAGLYIPEGRCGSCHFEHNGAVGVLPSGSQLCVECHATMDNRFTDTALVNVANFGRRHPEFKPQVIFDPQLGAASVRRISLVDRPKENNGLEFPHDFHLKDEEVMRKLETLPAPLRIRYGDDLDCIDCHQADVAGALIKPIEMERHCSDCHSLAFATSQNTVRTLPHGEPAEVRQTLEDFYLAQATQFLMGETPANILDRQLSAEARARRDRLRGRAIADAKRNAKAMIERLFSEEGICTKCHKHEDPATRAARASDIMPEFTPVRLTTEYFPMAHFNHAAHETGEIDCSTCHRAEHSSRTDDILMPSITVCRACHDDTSGRTGVASDCLTCHGYHQDDKAAPLMNPAHYREAVRGSSP